MKNKKKLCITIVVCLVVGIISGIAYFQVGKAAKKDNSQVVNESTTTKKDKGKTGKSLLNEINIKSYKDISKIVVGKNTQEDVSWVEPIQTITFTNKDDIDYLYNQLSQLKTLNKSGADDENKLLTGKVTDIKILDNLNILGVDKKNYSEVIDSKGNLLQDTIKYYKSGDGENSIDKVVKSRKVNQKFIYATVQYTKAILSYCIRNR